MHTEIPLPQHGAATNEIADWLELDALCAHSRSSGKARLKSVLSGVLEDPATIREEESSTTASTSLENDYDISITDVMDELSLRRRWAYPGYPFLIDAGHVVGPDDPVGARFLAYLFAFFWDRGTSSSTVRWPLVHADQGPKILQVISVIAAAGIVNGSAAWLGSPRPSEPNLYKALAKISARPRFGEGRPEAQRRAEIPTSRQDAGVDIFAWRHCPDQEPGKLYLLGQAASGRSWRSEKSPMQDFRNFHDDHWADYPKSPIIGATFIPFDFREIHKGDRGHSIDRHFLTRDFGIIVDRFRLAHFFGRGLKVAKFHHVEGIDQLPLVSTWVAENLNHLGAETNVSV